MTAFDKDKEPLTERQKGFIKVLELKLERLQKELNKIIQQLKTIQDEKEND